MIGDTKNYDIYNERMGAAIVDKCWWLNHIDDSITTILDVGCGDGALFTYVRSIMPNRFSYFGIEMDCQMRKLFREQHEGFDDAVVYPNVDSIPDNCRQAIEWEHTVVIFSSVIHEFLSYDQSGLYHLFARLCELKPQAIAVRDMNFDDDYFSTVPPLKCEEEAVITKCGELYADWTDTVDNSTFRRFTDYKYKLNKQCRFIEFLLKYRYTENWDKEKQERYLWDVKGTFYKSQLKNHYAVDFCECFYVPWIANKINEDLGFEFTHPTHIKMLLRMRREEGQAECSPYVNPSN